MDARQLIALGAIKTLDLREPQDAGLSEGCRKSQQEDLEWVEVI